MKKIYFFLCLALFVNCANAQIRDRIRWPCNSVKFDTIKGNFIAEVNAAGQFYFIGDMTIQENLVYIDRLHRANDVEQLYASDTAIKPFAELFEYIKGDSVCFDKEVMGVFRGKLSSRLMTGKERRAFGKATFTKKGVEYVRFSATLIVSNVGPGKWLCPGVFCPDQPGSSNKPQYCEKVFATTLLIRSVSDFKYR